jgi:hypothetical protein
LSGFAKLGPEQRHNQKNHKAEKQGMRAVGIPNNRLTQRNGLKLK